MADDALDGILVEEVRIIVTGRGRKELEATDMDDVVHTTAVEIAELVAITREDAADGEGTEVRFIRFGMDAVDVGALEEKDTIARTEVSDDVALEIHSLEVVESVEAELASNRIVSDVDALEMVTDPIGEGLLVGGVLIERFKEGVHGKDGFSTMDNEEG